MKNINLLSIIAIAAVIMFSMTACNSGNTATPVSNITVPGAVASFTVTPGNGQVILEWTSPSNNGGSAVTGYEVTMNNWTNKVEKTATELTHTYTGLTNGTGCAGVSDTFYRR